MHKKIFFCLVIILSFSNALCFNFRNPETKALLTTIGIAAGITATCALAALIPDKNNSVKEKAGLLVFSTAFSGILSFIIGKLTAKKIVAHEEARFQRAKNLGIMCGLVLPTAGFLVYCAGKDPRNIRNILEKSINLEKLFK